MLHQITAELEAHRRRRPNSCSKDQHQGIPGYRKKKTLHRYSLGNRDYSEEGALHRFHPGNRDYNEEGALHRYGPNQRNCGDEGALHCSRRHTRHRKPCRRSMRGRGRSRRQQGKERKKRTKQQELLLGTKQRQARDCGRRDQDKQEELHKDLQHQKSKDLRQQRQHLRERKLRDKVEIYTIGCPEESAGSCDPGRISKQAKDNPQDRIKSVELQIYINAYGEEDLKSCRIPRRTQHTTTPGGDKNTEGKKTEICLHRKPQQNLRRGVPETAAHNSLNSRQSGAAGNGRLEHQRSGTHLPSNTSFGFVQPTSKVHKPNTEKKKSPNRQRAGSQREVELRKEGLGQRAGSRREVELRKERSPSRPRERKQKEKELQQT